MDDNINSIRQFLHEFKAVNVEENVKCRSNIITSYYLNPEDVKAEVLDWSLHYLEQRKCPYSLALILAKLVAHQLSDSIYEMSLQAEEGIDDDDKRFRYESSQLYVEMTECLSEAIMNWQDHVDLNAVKVEPLPYIVSFFAIKNSRRKMEDRHVIIHDLNAMCGLKDAPRHSYYAIFDGHAGVEAASYCAAHLHWNITSHPEFFSNTEKAIFEAITLTDRNLLERSYREGIKGGCTALCCLIRENVIYIAWVGDSQAVLVKQGTPVPIGLPHKPDREDERCRIEELGGCVLFMGTWRVNGTLSVSRALGDAEHKPYISNEPEVLKIQLDGTEDYVVLACDGLWDRLQPSDIGQVVYSHIVDNAANVDEVASKLVQLSKSQGSTDNITAIVVFLSDPLRISKPDQIFPQLQSRNNENHCQINGTNPSDTLWNSEEIIHQTTTSSTDFVSNGISTTEQFNNELNSLNFSQNKVEPEILSNFQENTVTSETLIQQPCVSPTLYEESMLHNYSNRDTAFSNKQSTPTNVTYSVSNSNVIDSNHVINSLDCRDNIIADAEKQETINQNLNENLSPISVNPSDSSIIYTENIGVVEPNHSNLLEGSINICNTAMSEIKVSTLTNDSIVTKESVEPPVQSVIQNPLDLESTAQLPEVKEDHHLTKGREDIFRNNNEHLNLETDGSPYSNNLNSVMSNKNDTETKISDLAISNTFQTEVENPSNDVAHSINLEESYQQQEQSSLVLNDELNFSTSEMDTVTNNNLHSSPEHLNISIEKNKAVYSQDSSESDKSDILNGSITCDSKIDDPQAENRISDGVLNDMLDSKREAEGSTTEIGSVKSTDYTYTEEVNSYSRTVDIALNNNFQPETKSQESICADMPFIDNKQFQEGFASSTCSCEEDLLLHPDESPNCYTTEPAQELPSQNHSTIPSFSININPHPETVTANKDNTTFLLHCIDKTAYEEPKMTLQATAQSCTEPLNEEINMQNICISVDNSQPTSYISDYSANDKALLCTTNIKEHTSSSSNTSGSPQATSEQSLIENKTSTSSADNIESLPLNLQNTTYVEEPGNKETLDETQSKDDLSSEQKYNQEEKIPVSECPNISNEANSLHTTTKIVPSTVTKKTQAKHPHTKELSKSISSNKSTAAKKPAIKESALSSNIGSRKQIMQKPMKDSSTKPIQAQQPKIKQIVPSKDKAEGEMAAKPSVAVKPKSTQLSVFERLSTPKTIFTKPRENRNKEDLPPFKGSSRTSTKQVSESKIRNNSSQPNKELGALPKKINNHQSENAKTKGHSSTISNNKVNTKAAKPPLPAEINVSKTPFSNKLTVSKLPHRNLSQKTDTTRKSSNIRESDGIKNSSSFSNKEVTTKQRSSTSSKVTGKEELSTSFRQSTTFSSAVSKRLDTKHSNITSNAQSFNSRTVPVQSKRSIIEKSSISSKTTKQGKTVAVKSTNVQKKSDVITETGKNSQVQEASVADDRKGNLPSLEGQGDCINVNTEENKSNAGQSKLNTTESNEVPNHSLPA